MFICNASLNLERWSSESQVISYKFFVNSVADCVFWRETPPKLGVYIVKIMEIFTLKDSYLTTLASISILFRDQCLSIYVSLSLMVHFGKPECCYYP